MNWIVLTWCCRFLIGGVLLASVLESHLIFRGLSTCWSPIDCSQTDLSGGWRLGSRGSSGAGNMDSC